MCVCEYASFVFVSAVERWCECSRTLATGWSVHTNTNFAYPSIAIYCRHSHSASLHLARIHTPIVAIVIVHSSKLSIDWVFDSVDYTANCTYECSALCCAVQATEFYMYGKSFLFITAALINCIATRMGERKLNQTRLNKKRNKITKKHRTWNKNYWKEMQLYETSRRERKRVYVALGNKCIEVARHIRMNSTSISL